MRQIETGKIVKIPLTNMDKLELNYGSHTADDYNVMLISLAHKYGIPTNRLRGIDVRNGFIEYYSGK